MLCALTVRKLKPGTMEDFKAAFMPPGDMEAPPGWKRFYAVRNVADENEIITFGFFDGTLEELRATQDDPEGKYEDRRAASDEFVESVGADGIFEVFDERTME
jgi:heme-degrading monooxygenase HmoA